MSLKFCNIFFLFSISTERRLKIETYKILVEFSSKFFHIFGLTCVRLLKKKKKQNSLFLFHTFLFEILSLSYICWNCYHEFLADCFIKDFIQQHQQEKKKDYWAHHKTKTKHENKKIKKSESKIQKVFWLHLKTKTWLCLSKIDKSVHQDISE